MKVDRLDMGLQSGLDVPVGRSQTDYRALRRLPYCASFKEFESGESVIASTRLQGRKYFDSQVLS